MNEIEAAKRLCGKMEKNVFYCPVCEDKDVLVDDEPPQLFTVGASGTAKQCDYCETVFAITVYFAK